MLLLVLNDYIFTSKILCSVMEPCPKFAGAVPVSFITSIYLESKTYIVCVKSHYWHLNIFERFTPVNKSDLRCGTCFL